MKEFVKQSDIKIECSIEIMQIKHLIIKGTLNQHGEAHIKAVTKSENARCIYSGLDSQPLKIYIINGSKKDLLFHGVIDEVAVDRETEYVEINITAYTKSKLMDLELKNRSYQDTNITISDLIDSILEIYKCVPLYNADDKKISKPLIQYYETDWMFLKRLSSHLQVPVIVASNYHGNGLSIGFQDCPQDLKLEAEAEAWCMDLEQIEFSNYRTKDATYYKVISKQIFHLGEVITYRNEKMRIHQVSMKLRHSVLECEYHLASTKHFPVSIQYNDNLRGISLSGVVLERNEETIKVHLDIDKEQELDKAFDFPWVPEYGNLLYCMPEKGSIVRLLIPNKDEGDAVGIQCIRQNGVVCSKTQSPENRWFQTKEQKYITFQPELLELLAPINQSNIRLEDNAGNQVLSRKEITVQSAGNLFLSGKKVIVSAPKEVTIVRRQVGEPTVVNICHNLDVLGGKSIFENLDDSKKINTDLNDSSEEGTAVKPRVLNVEKAEKEKLKISSAHRKLMEEDKYIKEFELGSTITNVMAAIPQNNKGDQLSKIALGFRPTFGAMKGES